MIRACLGKVCLESRIAVFASAFDGEDTNSAEEEYYYAYYNAECYYIHSIRSLTLKEGPQGCNKNGVWTSENCRKVVLNLRIT